MLRTEIPSLESIDGAVYTRVLRSSGELAQLQEEWNSLLERCPSHTIFSTPDWLIPIAEQYQHRLRLLTIAVYQGDQLIGLAPLAVGRRRALLKVLRFLGAGPFKYSLSDYGDIICSQGKEAIVARAVMGCLRDLAAEWQTIDLAEIPETSPMLPLLMDEAHRLRWVHTQEPCGMSFVLPLVQTWEEYLSSLSPNFRQELERKTRKLQRESQGRFQVISGFEDEEELNASLDLLTRLHTVQWQAQGLPGIFADEGIGEFLKKVATRFGRKGSLFLGVLHGAQGPLGISFNFRHRGVLYYYISGHDPSGAYSKYSLGTLLNRYAIDSAIQGGDSAFNFLRGRHHYKTRFGASPLAHYRLRIWRRRPFFLAHLVQGALRKRAGRAVRSLREILRR